jgi:hypothetical protein
MAGGMAMGGDFLAGVGVPHDNHRIRRFQEDRTDGVTGRRLDEIADVKDALGSGHGRVSGEVQCTTT